MKKLYGRTPNGEKRMIRCGCNDKFKRDDPKTECFEIDACPKCGRYPWYRIKAGIGGKRRDGDGR